MKKMMLCILISLSIMNLGCTSSNDTVISLALAQNKDVFNPIYTDINNDCDVDALFIDNESRSLLWIDGKTLKTKIFQLDIVDFIGEFELVYFNSDKMILVVPQSSGSGLYQQPMLFKCQNDTMVDTFSQFGEGIDYSVENIDSRYSKMIVREPEYKAFLLDRFMYSDDYVSDQLAGKQSVEIKKVNSFYLTKRIKSEENCLSIVTEQKITLYASWDEYGILQARYLWKEGGGLLTSVEFIPKP